MITSIQIEGYRSLKDVTWHPGRLNVLIGPNGSGKSNLLRALDLLHKSAKGELSKAILRQGGIGQILWDGRAEKLRFRFYTQFAEYLLELTRLPTNIYSITQESFIDLASEISSAEWGVHDNRDPVTKAELYTADGKLLAGHFTIKASPLESVLSVVSDTDSPSEKLNGTRNVLRSFAIFHDLRVDHDAEVRRAAVTRLEKHLDPDGQNLVPALHTLYTGNQEFKNDLNQAMRAAYGDEFEELSFPPAADQHVQMRIRWKSLKRTQPMADLSDGTLRFLMLVAILANPDPQPLIAIDEPEAGLHPAMLPIVAELAWQASAKSQVILSTHSPQMLDAFGDKPPVTTVAQWENGETKLAVLDGEELARWLKAYSLGALFKSGELEGMGPAG